MTRRALIIQGGTMRGAYFVGALKVFHAKLGPDYFDAIFSTSVGIFEQATFASGQMRQMEYVWREYVTGKQLINFFNLLRGKPILDLDYLMNLFQSNDESTTKYNVSAINASRYDLYTFVLDHKTGEIKMRDLKKNNLFDLMRAACALPFLYPKKVLIDGRRYVDAGLTPHRKFQKVLREHLQGYDEIISVVSDKHFNNIYGLGDILKPSRMPLWYVLDTNKNRIHATIHQGEIDAENFLKKKGII